MDPKADSIPDKDRVDTELRTYFAAQRSRAKVPDFDAVMAKAAHQLRRDAASELSWRGIIERRVTPPRLAFWGAGVAVTAVLATVVWLGTAGSPADQKPNETILAALPAELAVTQQELLADIHRTTRWQAPSDQWLAVRTTPDVFGLPDLGDPRNRQIMQEKHL